MFTYVLDFSHIKSTSEAHAYISQVLGFPEYYGANLDALYDCLTELSSSCNIVLLNIETLEQNFAEQEETSSDYAGKLFNTFQDASNEAGFELKVEF